MGRRVFGRCPEVGQHLTTDRPRRTDGSGSSSPAAQGTSWLGGLGSAPGFHPGPLRNVSEMWAAGYRRSSGLGFAGLGFAGLFVPSEPAWHRRCYSKDRRAAVNSQPSAGEHEASPSCDRKPDSLSAKICLVPGDFSQLRGRIFWPLWLKL